MVRGGGEGGRAGQCDVVRKGAAIRDVSHARGRWMLGWYSILFFEDANCVLFLVALDDTRRLRLCYRFMSTARAIFAADALRHRFCSSCNTQSALPTGQTFCTCLQHHAKVKGGHARHSEAQGRCTLTVLSHEEAKASSTERRP